MFDEPTEGSPTMPDTDAVLRALAEQLAALDEGAVRDEIEEFERQMTELNDKIQARRRALEMKQAQAPAPVPTETPGQTGSAPAKTVGRTLDVSAKRHLAVEIMRQAPNRGWTPQDIRHALIERGVEPDAGTPIRRVLWDGERRGVFIKAGDGLYALKRPYAEVDAPMP